MARRQRPLYGATGVGRSRVVARIEHQEERLRGPVVIWQATGFGAGVEPVGARCAGPNQVRSVSV